MVDTRLCGFLSGVPESPQIWAYFDQNIYNPADPNYALYIYPTPVSILNTSYTYKNVKQQKLVQVTFDCEVAQKQIKQNI